jgi:hypothetical protein
MAVLSPRVAKSCEGKNMNIQMRTRTGRMIVFCVGALGLALSSMATHAQSDLPVTSLPNQDFAYCAGSLAWVFDNVAYADCLVKFGNSVSGSFDYPPVPETGQPGGNINTVNELGINQKSYIVSTYSTTDPPSGALYTCSKTSTGSYAQCDGGICFRSTQGAGVFGGTKKAFPGLGNISSNNIVCSCPIVRHDPTSDEGYGIAGPYPCVSAQAYNNLCNNVVSNGSILYIGAPSHVIAAVAVFQSSRGAKICPPPH